VERDCPWQTEWTNLKKVSVKRERMGGGLGVSNRMFCSKKDSTNGGGQNGSVEPDTTYVESWGEKACEDSEKVLKNAALCSKGGGGHLLRGVGN